MGSKKKRFDIERIVQNANMLSDPQIYECFIYECEDPDGFDKIESEINELADSLPESISILDLPHIICGNRMTKTYGRATCSTTNGHLILENESKNRVIFDSEEEAKKAGFRPCARCMFPQFLKWKNKMEET